MWYNNAESKIETEYNYLISKALREMQYGNVITMDSTVSQCVPMTVIQCPSATKSSHRLHVMVAEASSKKMFHHFALQSGKSQSTDCVEPKLLKL
jgi:hypothetical protein